MLRILALSLLATPALAQEAAVVSGTGAPYDLVESEENPVLRSRTPETYHPDHGDPNLAPVTGIDRIQFLPGCEVEGALLGPGVVVDLGDSFMISWLAADSMTFEGSLQALTGERCGAP